MYPEYFNNRNSKKYNLDNLYKNIYQFYIFCLDQKYKLNI